MMSPRAQNGTITLTVVFLTAMTMLILAFGDHTRVLRQAAAVTSDVATEQSFYAAQSCVEEGYLQLREDAGYRMLDSLMVGEGSCALTIEPDIAHGTSGKLSGIGTDRTAVRGVASRYTDAGPTASRADTSIFHILDRSGSMDDDGDGCTIPAYGQSASCLANGGAWGMQPLTSVKTAAKSLSSMLLASNDRLGLVSYGESPDTVILNHGLTTDFVAVEGTIDLLEAGGRTDIGDAVKKATDALSAEPAGRVRIIILLTDGMANMPGDEANADTYARTQASIAKQSPNNTLIFTIGLGDAVEGPVPTALLTDMASVLNGVPQYYHAPDATALQGIYTGIANLIVNYNISQSSWREE